MDLTPWSLQFKSGWDRHFVHFDKSIRNQILNKLQQMKQPLPGRGLHGSHLKIEEVGGYRIAFEEDEQTRTKRVHFVGNHKQYAEWFCSI